MFRCVRLDTASKIFYFIFLPGGIGPRASIGSQQDIKPPPGLQQHLPHSQQMPQHLQQQPPSVSSSTSNQSQSSLPSKK